MSPTGNENENENYRMKTKIFLANRLQMKTQTSL